MDNIQTIQLPTIIEGLLLALDAISALDLPLSFSSTRS
jgi:hypothetical protein